VADRCNRRDLAILGALVIGSAPVSLLMLVGSGMTIVLMGGILLAMGLLIPLIRPGETFRERMFGNGSVKMARLAYDVIAILGAVVLTRGVLTIVFEIPSL
jgi:hypothetical protein